MMSATSSICPEGCSVYSRNIGALDPVARVAVMSNFNTMAAMFGVSEVLSLYYNSDFGLSEDDQL